MELLSIGTWNALLDLAALTLCGITVLYIAGKKKSLSTRTFQEANDERIRSIVEKTFDQFIRINPGPSFNGVIDRVTRDQAIRPSPGRGAVSADRRVKTQADMLTKPKRRSVNTLETGQPTPPKTGDDKTMRVYQFTASGMSVKKISEKLAIPRCEVELIAKFQQRDSRRAAVL